MNLMKLRSLAVLLFVIVGVAFSPFSVAQESHIETTKATAEEAYAYGFPLVMNYKVFHGSFLDPKAKGYKGPLNQIHNEAQLHKSRLSKRPLRWIRSLRTCKPPNACCF
jgi:hypothetical protein